MLGTSLTWFSKMYRRTELHGYEPPGTVQKLVCDMSHGMSINSRGLIFGPQVICELAACSNMNCGPPNTKHNAINCYGD